MQTRETEAFVQHVERRLVAVAGLWHRRIARPQPSPKPAILRRLRIFDHHRPGRGLERLAFVASGGTGRIHLFNDHRAVRYRVNASIDEPLHYRGRIVDPHCGMSAEISSVDERASVTHALIDAPTEL